MRFTWNDKLKLEKMLKDGETIVSIARYFGCCRNTVYREIRNGQVEILTSEYEYKTVYAPEKSQAHREQVLMECAKPLKIGKDYGMAAFIVGKIENGYSPAAVASLLPAAGFSCTLSRNTIYKYIDRGYLYPLTNKNLRIKGKRKRPYNTIKRAARPSRGDSIERRPEVINSRSEIGHWEMDSVEGKKGTKKTLLVLTERMSRAEIICKMNDQTAYSVVETMDKLQAYFGDQFSKIFKSIAVDNGSEFMDLAGMERDGRTKIYYCHPRFPGERGSNENINRMIRWFFPKGTDFRNVSQAMIEYVASWLNDYPRLLHGWKSARSVAEENGLYFINTIS